MEPSVDRRMSISAAVDTEGWRDARSAIFVSVSSCSSPSSETYSAVEHPSALTFVVPGSAEESLLSLCDLGSKKDESSDFLNLFFTGGISLPQSKKGVLVNPFARVQGLTLKLNRALISPLGENIVQIDCPGS